MSFKLISTQTLGEIKSVGHLYAHPSGAQLMYIQNDDENKVFSATFKTPAGDDTGVAHIVEHCVLCGSEKYPIKDPFNELAKGSLYTYLNAMTFRDKTMYPIASCHEKDFYNLMDVYLDAVFFPLVARIDRKEIFLQEGWNFQINDSQEISAYGGIVYSEMKGVYSDPIEQLMLSTYKRLFQGTQYCFDAGGVPEKIVDLQYEKFLDYYKRYYHPANCYLYLYGKLDIEKYLDHIDKNYLSRFNHKEKTKAKADSEIIQTKEWSKPAFEEVSYFYHGDEKTDNKKYLGVSYAMENVHDNKHLMAAKILNHYLLAMENSPLKQTLNDGKLGRQILNKFDESIPKPVFSVLVKYTEKSVEQLKNTIDETIKDILEKGLDDELLEACINQFEFLLLEENYGYKPKGLAYHISMARDWLYGHDPFSKAYRMRYLEQIKQDKDYLLETLRKFVLENKHCVCVTLCPVQQVVLAKESLTAAQIEDAIKDSEKLERFQSKEDDRAEIEKIPILSLSDIHNSVVTPPIVERDISGMRVLHCPLESNDIIYLDVMFEVSHIPQHLLSYVGVLRYILGKLATENYHQNDLPTGINRYFGGFYFSIKTFTNAKLKGGYEPKLILKAKFLKSNAGKAFVYIGEVIQKTLFENETQIQALILELLSKIQSRHNNDGQHVAIHRVKSYLQQSYQFEEQMVGLDFYDFLKKQAAEFHENWDDFYTKLKEVFLYVFNKEGTSLVVTCNEEIYKHLQDELCSFSNRLYHRTDKQDHGKNKYMFDHSIKNEGIMVGSQVQYVAKALDYGKKGLVFNGHLNVLQSILNGDYLMNEVRLKGGAYGCHLEVLRNGLMVFYSYRDPHLNQTLSVYENAGHYVRQLKLDRREMQKYRLGTINQYLKPKGVAETSRTAIDRYLQGISAEDLMREREEILSTTSEHINHLAFIFEECLYENYICAVGNEEKILKSRDIFFDIINLL